MSDKMEDLFANVKKMVDSGNIPPEVKQMMNNLQNQGTSNSSNNNFNNYNDNSSNTKSNNNMDLNNLLSQVSPEMINNLSNMLNSSGQFNLSDSTSYENSCNSNSSETNNSNFRSNDSSNGPNNFNIDINTIMKMKSIMEKMNNKNDPRANLLYSLKPYLRDSKKDKLDQYVNMLNISKIADIMNKPNNGKKTD